MENILEEIRKELIRNVDDKSKDNFQNFFREKIKYYGVRVPVVNKIAKTYFKKFDIASKAVIFNLCEKLWQSGIIEESFIASNWTFSLHKQYEPADINIFEKWINLYVNNWASCDSFCNHSVGKFIEMYPECLGQLKDFAKSGNRWMRRASAVSLILPARKGEFLIDIFEIADILLYDKDDLVQKGYGWLLKAASEQHQKEVFDYVMKNQSMPRTALRYAIEKMPEELKIKALKK